MKAKRVFKKIFVGLAAAVALLVVVVALQPSTFRITRSATVAAPASVVLAQVKDLHRWEKRSPWQNLDTAVKGTYDGPASGPGAKFAWAGNNKVGAGRMEITESHPSDLVKIRLEFIKPFAATNATVFTFRPNGGGTQVTWDMSGENNFMGKAFGLIMNMDRLVGGDFEKGLANMKQIVETGARN
jgi:hypothetical protein